jgi:hypothetical protein
VGKLCTLLIIMKSYFFVVAATAFGIAACDEGSHDAARAQASAAEVSSRKNVDDPEPGKFGGPSTNDIYQLFGMSEDFNAEYKIRRGQPLVASGSGPIPGGTTIFPIKINFTSKIFMNEQKREVYFYVDPYGDWQVVSAD